MINLLGIGLNYRRWLIVGYLLALMVFTTSVLLIPGQKYDTLTTSDSGWVYNIAAEIDRTNDLPENNPLSHAPYGLPVRLTEQLQPLLTVMLHRGVRAVSPSVELEDVVKYWGPLIFALSLIPLFLIGRELGGDLAGCAAVFFAATLASTASWMSSPIYWHKVGAFDREPIQVILGAWAIYLVIKMLKAPRSSIPKFALLGGLVFGLFGLAWGSGGLYLIPVVILTLVFAIVTEKLKWFPPILLVGVLFAIFSGERGGGAASLLYAMIGAFTVSVIIETVSTRVSFESVLAGVFAQIRKQIHLIIGVLGMLVVITLALWAMAEQSPTFWIGFVQLILGPFGFGAGGGVSLPRYAGEAAPLDSFGDITHSFYGTTILTSFAITLVILALAKFCWSKKRWELLTFAWLIVLLTMIWPGTGQVRYMRMWWLLGPVLAGAGVTVLVSLIQKASLEQYGEWLRHFQDPIAIVLCITVVATPFAINAYATAGITTPPTGAVLDEGFMDAFRWIRDNTPPDSVVAIEWSYGHLLTGTARRAAVTDGAETLGEAGEWENKAKIRPPDYIYTVSDLTGTFLESHWTINGRRTDVQYLPTLTNDNELEFYFKTYRDNYGVEIDYVIFHRRQYESAVFASYHPQRGNPKPMSSPASIQDGKVLYTFGDQTVFFDLQQGIAYMTVDGENLSLAGIVFLHFDRAGTYRGYDYTFVENPGVPRVLWIYIVEGTAWDQTSALLTAPTVYGWPMVMRVFEGRGAIPDFMENVYTSKNEVVKVIQIHHKPKLKSPPNATTTNDNTPEFRWTGAVGAVRYELQVDDNPDFPSPEIKDNSLTSPTYAPLTPLPEGDYSWRVAAHSEQKFLGWSEVFTLTVDTTPPAAPKV